MIKDKAQMHFQECIVKIYSKRSVGTGFFIDYEKIVTCHHVIKNSAPVDIKVLWGDKKLEVKSVESIESDDLCLITVDLEKHSYVQIDEKIKLRDPCFSFGFPPEYREEGDTLLFEFEGQTDDVLKFKNGQFEPGFSGAPILNLSTGKVCGVIKRSRDLVSDLGGRGIPISKLFNFKQLANIKEKQNVRNKKIIYKRWAKIISFLTVFFIVSFTLTESALWANRNNLPFAYSIIKPLWGLGFYKPFPEMVKISSGKFIMGCMKKRDNNHKKTECDIDEKPSHLEVIENSFWIGKYEVTFIQYDYFIWYQQKEGINAFFPHANYAGRFRQPVININWHDAINYSKWLSKQTGKNYTLPSEKEWEYSARANSLSKYYWGDNLPTTYANCKDCNNSVHSTMPVGSFKENSFGLYDTSGNVWEWTDDDYTSTDNELTDIFGPINQVKGLKVVKGGSFLRTKRFIRPSEREAVGAINGSLDLGFRVINN